MSSSGSISGPSHAASGSQLCSTGTTCSVTGVSITAGQTIIASNWNGNNYQGTCSDNLGTPTVYYNILSSYNSSFGGGPLVTCWGVATVSGTATVTFTNDSTTSADRMGISECMAKAHMARAFRCYGVRNRTALAVLALEESDAREEIQT